MNDVVGMLEFALQLQESVENEKGEEISCDAFTSELSVTTTSTIEDHTYHYKDSYNTLLSWNPFSEITDPNPR